MGRTSSFGESSPHPTVRVTEFGLPRFHTDPWWLPGTLGRSPRVPVSMYVKIVTRLNGESGSPESDSRVCVTVFLTPDCPSPGVGGVRNGVRKRLPFPSTCFTRTVRSLFFTTRNNSYYFR